MEIVAPKSVVDVGCGVGTWLSVFAEHGVSDHLGLDGEYVDETLLQIDHDRFARHNLQTPFHVDRKFDLAVCLEVAEHLPESSAVTLVDTLTRLADSVLFSAAIPGQGGGEHFNEQWPEYWAGLFGRSGYLPLDCIRGRVWSDRRVSKWYRQNTLLFVSETSRHYDVAKSATDSLICPPLSIVNPEYYLPLAQSRTIRLVKRIPEGVRRPISSLLFGKSSH